MRKYSAGHPKANFDKSPWNRALLLFNVMYKFGTKNHSSRSSVYVELLGSLLKTGPF